MGKKIERFVIKISDSNPQVSEDKKFKDSVKGLKILNKTIPALENDLLGFRGGQDGSIYLFKKGNKYFPIEINNPEEITEQDLNEGDTLTELARNFFDPEEEGYRELVSELKSYLKDEANWEYLESSNSKDVKDSKTRFVDMNADEIINLINEAGAKGRSWYWLKGKLPEEFLTLYGRGRGMLFPVKNNSRVSEGGVHLTKPTELGNDIDWSWLDEYHIIKAEIDAIYDKYGAKTDDELNTKLGRLYKEEDSISKRALIESDKQKFRELCIAVRDIFTKYKLPDMTGYYYWTFYEKRNFAFDKNKYMKELRNSYQNRSHKERQLKTVIGGQKGEISSDDDKVVPLTPEAEAYIRRIMREEDTEDIKRKRIERSGRRINYSNSKDILHLWEKDRNELKELLDDLKKLQNRGTMGGLRYEGPRTEYKYTGNGPYDYKGNYMGSASRGGYEPTGRKTKAYTEVLGVNGEAQKPLTDAITRAFGARTVSELRKALEDALDAVKFLPEDTDKITEAKQKIVDFIEEKRAEMQTRREGYTKRLPDKKFGDAKEKSFIIEIERRDRKREQTFDNMEEALEYFSYTLEKGYSWQHEKGNKKINKNPKTPQELVKNLNNSESNAAANGNPSTYYSLKKPVADKKVKDSNMKIYLFAMEDLHAEDLNELDYFNLQLLGENYFEDEENYVVRGREDDLRDFAEEYLSYELHPDYLYDEDEFAGDIE